MIRPLIYGAVLIFSIALGVYRQSVWVFFGVLIALTIFVAIYELVGVKMNVDKDQSLPEKKSAGGEPKKSIFKKENPQTKGPFKKASDPNQREYGKKYDIYNDKLDNDPHDDDD